MENEIMLVGRAEISTEVKEVPLTDLALQYMEASKSENTLANYRHSIKLFSEYMIEKHGLDLRYTDHCQQVSQEMICNYLSYLTSEERAKKGKKYKPLKAASVLRHLSAIRDFFGYVAEIAKKPIPNPTIGKKVSDTVKGIQRRLGTAPNPKRAVTLDVAGMILAEIEGNDLIDLRDAAIISLGFAGAFRRSELAGADVEHLIFKDSGILFYLPRSKTDQTGEGAWKHIAYGQRKTTCPVRLVERWIKAAGIKEGALFRSIGKGGRLGGRIHPASIARILKDRAEAAGLDRNHFSGHSLRRGFITYAYENGVDMVTIMQHTGHKRFETAKRYVEMIDIEKNSATKGLY
ncbi:tyrosine-type recombinase/integrase [Thermoactinomyces daqus]|uniref:Tyrosine-type recombinase/integrase n=1 Tax=Thermoactinomyces daqus TaxID=1329516 RepID=A0A7W2AIQ2_9BACL|nr:site-specific integrase [Thermoactinomyces daqus]MBA4544497.1 tyrosine-type recombinase/integrase [Thermoactinomyces daqus]